METDLYMRKVSLILVEGEDALDLSQMHFKFQSAQQEDESPDNCSIRIWNLSDDTVKKIKGQFSKIVLQAGYEGSAFGIIFQGTIKQYRQGKETDGISTYLDILAADGDIAYNWSMTKQSFGAGSTLAQRLAAFNTDLGPHGASIAIDPLIAAGGITNIRGKIAWGLTRGLIRQEAANIGASWGISKGRINIVPLDGYLPGEAVVLTSQTGLIGRVEQTEGGMKCRCLMNPKLVVGNLLKIDNASINTTTAALNAAFAGGQQAYDKWAGPPQTFASISGDGLYRIYVIEFTGDTRGNDFYCDIIGLAVDPATLKVKLVGN